jgi:hypothetical protein
MPTPKKYVVGGFGGQSHVTSKPSLKRKRDTRKSCVQKQQQMQTNKKKKLVGTAQPSFFFNFIFVPRAAVVSHIKRKRKDKSPFRPFGTLTASALG